MLVFESFRMIMDCILSLDCKLRFNKELPRFDYNLHNSNDIAVSN